MATKIAKTGITRERGWLYYLDKKGDVSRAKMARGGGKKPQKAKPQVVTKVGVTRETGFLYFIDKDGDVAKTRMAKPGARRSTAKRSAKRASSARRTGGAKRATPRKATRTARKPAARRTTRRVRR